MSDFTIYGPAPSTFVRTARIYCEEKGVAYDLEEVDFADDSYKEIHPFSHIPAIKHGDFTLYETQAIGRYVDAAFDGPQLQPADIKARAIQDQWMSALCHYVDRAIVRELVIERVVAPMRGRESDEDVIAAAVPKVEYQLDIIGDTLSKSDYLAGDALSLADPILLPMLTYLRLTPEGGKLLDGRKAVNAWYDRMAERPSSEATLPPMLKAAE